MIFRFIEEHRRQWPVTLQCEVLGVTRQGFYAWRSRKPSKTALYRAELTEAVKQVYHQNRQVYGAVRIQKELQQQGHACNRKTVAKVMKSAGISAATGRAFRVTTTDSNHAHAVAENVLNRDFSATRKNQKWVADITYVRTQEGWLYLAAVMDLFSRKIVGWAMSEKIDSRLVVDALEMAVKREVPGQGLVTHSDRGVQYASDHYRRLLRERGMTCSMSRRGNCWDNAPMESFFATLKKELVHRCDYPTRLAARPSIFEYIEVFYNRTRRHSALGYLSPENFVQTS